MKPRLPIGISSFRKIRQDGYFFADKSALVRLVFDASANVILLPRPRRFGKTLGISMLKCFLDRAEPDAVRLFEGLAIAEDQECMARLGRFPVVCLSLKGVRGEDWQVAHDLLAHQIGVAAQGASELGEFLTGRELRDWERLCAREADEACLRQSLKSLLTWLYRCHGERVVVLIDEYDTPVHEAYRYGYYEEAVTFFRTWLGEGLKLENAPDALEKAVVTGIMRVAKESLFSGLNNFRVYPVHEPGPFESVIGFTEADVKQALAVTMCRGAGEVVSDWYNGYDFGTCRVYNPWSVLSFLDDGATIPRPYWVNTSSNDLVVEALESAGADVREQLRQLLAGEELRQPLTDAAVLREGIHAEDLWSFLVAAGYLTADRPEPMLGEVTYRLRVPNREVRTVFHDVVTRWLRHCVRFDAHRALLLAFVRADVPEFARLLQELTLNLLSYHDLAKDKPAEAVFQGFCLGILAGMAGDWQVESNREHGLGRADIVLTPKDTSQRGFVLEFKSIAPDADLDSALADALDQIEAKRYAAGLRAAGITDILELAIVLQGKTIRVKTRA